MLALYLIILGLICGRFEGNNKVIKSGGYTAKICINSIKQNLRGIEDPGSPGNRNFSCSDTNNSCTQGRIYRCGLPCNINYVKSEIDDRKLNLDTIKNLRGVIISNKKVDNTENNLTIKVTFDLSLLLVEEIVLIFHSDPNLTCSLIKVSENIIKCTLDISKMKVGMVNKTEVSVRYGFEKCNQTFSVGIISLKWLTFTQRLWSKYYWTLVVMILLMSGGSIVFIIIKKNNSVMINNLLHRKELQAQEIKYVKSQMKDFYEYQTSVDSLSDLGLLTPRHLLNMGNYLSRILNIELSMDSSSYKFENCNEFIKFILCEEKFVKWIGKMEMKFKLQQKCQVASLLTIILFQHSEYFLRIIKRLLIKYLTDLKQIGDERVAFRKSETIVALLVGNWITICMYKSLESGNIGKRYYELYRALKCKINQGPVDCFTNKAKYALTFDSILLRDVEYKVLDIKSNVNLDLKIIDSSSEILRIRLRDVDIKVLDIDSITQVKEKIIDKSIQFYLKNEDIKGNQHEQDLCIDLIDLNDIRLQLVHNHVKVFLNDFDSSSVTSTIDANCHLVNNLKHYNIHSGMYFLLSSVDDAQGSSLTTSCFPKIIGKIHLQLSKNIQKQAELQRKVSIKSLGSIEYNPVVDDINKEFCLIRLLESKKSVLDFIDGFFQSIFNYEQNKDVKRISLYEKEQRPLLKTIKGAPEVLITEEMYLTPIYFLFNMFDDIAKSLIITDTQIISLWKSNSFIVRFWMNLIKNPNFIFSVAKNDPIDRSLITIADVLMKSCSDLSSTNIVNENTPIVTQLFFKEIKVYSSWWKSFIKCATPINHQSIIYQMEYIAQKFKMNKYYNSSLTSLQEITKYLVFPDDQ